MKLAVPILIEEERHEGKKRFAARPIFFHGLQRRGEKLTNVLNRLADDLRRALGESGKQMDHRLLLDFTYCPDFEEHQFELAMELKQGRVKGKFQFVTVRQLDRTLVYVPQLPNFCFELLRGQDLRARAEAVLHEEFKAMEKAGRPEGPGTVVLKSTARVSTLEVEFEPAATPRTVATSPFALLGDDQVLDGAEELRRVGYCLNNLYPDELEGAVLREREVEEVGRALKDRDRRPIALVGPRKVGKTAVVHEFVNRQMVLPSADVRVWLVSPQRLISGMSYVGQWEGRLQAILDHAAKAKLVLYFDDLPGLFLAGLSAQSTLNVAEVMKPRLEKREVRVLAEITPEAFRRLQERDRTFTDLFQIIPLREPTEAETRRILISVQRNLEMRHRCTFTLDALPSVMDVQSRYAGDQAFPGKAALFLKHLGIKQAGAEIDRDAVLREFRAISGLNIGFLNREGIAAQEVEEGLSSTLVGQRHAVRTLREVISTARARLNDTTKPLASLLFLGPTGVGKTECAKAVARYLFGSPERLVRFDMNEYVEEFSVDRLVGTLREPEGLLTSAIRHQPFCVLLLDEIEKAHPKVFDLLLAVLGEGRLTDALGRTTNFGNCIIILSSNLGARESRSRVGFRSADESDSAIYVQAAEKFFRPEFFNRLDHVIPFESLTRADIQQIVYLLTTDLLSRDGLASRKCALNINDGAMDLLAKAGFHPQLGARALKRVVERELVEPVARALAAFEPGAPAMIQVTEAGGVLTTHTHVLRPVSRLPDRRYAEPREFLDRVDEAMARLEPEMERFSIGGRVTVGEVTPEQAHYFGLIEQRNLIHTLSHVLEARLYPKRVARGGRIKPSRAVTKREMIRYPDKVLYLDMMSTLHLQTAAGELAEPESEEPINRLMADLANELALFQFMIHNVGGPQRFLVNISHSQSSRSAGACEMNFLFHEPFALFWGFTLRHRLLPWAELSADQKQLRKLVGEGEFYTVPEITSLYGWNLLHWECGTHLYESDTGEPIIPLRFELFASEDDLKAVWFPKGKDGSSLPDDVNSMVKPMVRYHSASGRWVDFHTGLSGLRALTAADWRHALLSKLPLPPELEVQS